MSVFSNNSTPAADQVGPCDIILRDVELFQRFLRSFVPEKSFDAHAHWWDLEHLVPEAPDYVTKMPSQVGWTSYCEQVGKWMGDRTPSAGLFFSFPAKSGDYQLAISSSLINSD